MEKKELKALVDGLISSEHCPFSEDHRQFLEGLSETDLKGFVDKLEATTTNTASEDESGDEKADDAKPAVTETKPELEPEVVQLKKSEYARLSAMADAYEVSQSEYKKTLLSSLKDNESVKRAYTEDELSKLDIPALERVAKMAGIGQLQTTPAVVPVTDFRAQGGSSRGPVDSSNNRPDPPPSMSDKIRALRGIKTESAAAN